MASLLEQNWPLGTPLVQNAHLQMVSKHKCKDQGHVETAERHLAVHNGFGNRQHQGVAHCAHVGCSVLSQLPEELILSLQPAWEHSLPSKGCLPPKRAQQARAAWQT